MLRIAKLTDYAIVVLAHLAREAHVCVHPASSIADATGIPQPTVSKVLKSLVRDGLVLSSRGVAGGYSLAKDPRDLSVADVVVSIEGHLALTACAIDGLECNDQSHCQVAGHWPRINAAVVAALSQVSILEIARPEVRSPAPGPAAVRS